MAALRTSEVLSNLTEVMTRAGTQGEPCQGQQDRLAAWKHSLTPEETQNCQAQCLRGSLALINIAWAPCSSSSPLSIPLFQPHGPGRFNVVGLVFQGFNLLQGHRGTQIQMFPLSSLPFCCCLPISARWTSAPRAFKLWAVSQRGTSSFLPSAIFYSK